MNKNMFFAVMIAVTLLGCAKKEEAQIPMDLPESFNQAMSPQDGLTLIQDASAKADKTSTAATSNMSAPIQAMAPVSSTAPMETEIQQALKNAGLYEGKIDGDIGPRTKKAIKDFQSQNGLKADGKVGQKTWLKLQPFLAQPPDPRVETP